jgi:outer membrane protein OmpA-like peptidoglycan-associated protein
MQPSADRDLALDRDGDGIPDGEDACPDVSGTSNEDPALHGCPRMRATETAIYLPKPIYFAIDSATILGASESALGELATYLREHEEVRKLSIEGHTDAVGDATANLHLSELRAAAVMEWLIERGVDASRLTSKGYGTSRPVADNATLEGRELNRRVEFKILERL